jgi:hypothetical protein
MQVCIFLRAKLLVFWCVEVYPFLPRGVTIPRENRCTEEVSRKKKRCTEEVAEAFDSALLCVQGQTAMASVISVAAFFCQDSHQKHFDPTKHGDGVFLLVE